MIDAYTIGITLALDNGVTSGIATIRQDLAALDRAVAASTIGLLAIRRLADGLDVAAPIRSPNPPASLPQQATPVMEPALAQPSIVPVTASFAVPPSAQVSAERVPTAPVPAPKTLSTVLRALLPPARQLTMQSGAPPAALAAPVALVSQSLPVRPMISEPNRTILKSTPIAATQPPVPMSPSRTTSSTSITAPFPIQVGPPVELYRRPTRHPLAPTHSTPSATPLPAAPKATATRSHPATRAETQTLAMPISGQSPSSTNQATGFAHGEIILDSVRLGRWMSDRLARAAGRPASGITAFDPRIGAIYPGAPNGA